MSTTVASVADAMDIAQATHPGFYQKVVFCGDYATLYAPTLRRYSVQGTEGAMYHIEAKATARLKKGGREWYAAYWRLDNELRWPLEVARRRRLALASPHHYEWIDVDGGEAYR